MSELEEQIAEEMEADEDESSDDESTGSDQPDDTGGEAEAAAAPAAARSQKEIEELTGKLEREAERHAKRVAEIMGDDFALLVPNPTDWTPGFIFDVPEMHPLPEQVAALHALLGSAPPAEYPHDPDRQACDECLGSGKLRTGSQVPAQSALDCRFCNGYGWIGEGNPKREPFKIAAVPPLPPSAPMSPDAYQVKDSWGRPAGHVHFGIDPVAIGA